jgi:NhaA family Na+:H+ antiporter
VLGAPLTAAVGLALVLGKPIGIVAAVSLVVRCGWARLPEGSSWRALWACGCLSGIGFTMSLFVASLGLEGELLGEAKGGVLLGSAASLLVGMTLLHLSLPRVKESKEIQCT